MVELAVGIITIFTIYTISANDSSKIKDDVGSKLDDAVQKIESSSEACEGDHLKNFKYRSLVFECKN